ncbi:hypothetical protein SU69_02865 [Thermosipho melanesiensis]|uniref:Uncharacterized conserved protein UCP033563 n=2 Tax=Thermosipho melanesiensis TaxID=46541 RepID=A6LKH5_THEM4|nr:DUF1015 family protein [Thermosipho melanesiensis]ABR30426.1 uncharacterised conserved protein UCP033563 [Thermosipho melanesiensis BI429]APT73586.1 hypothetical protein BW47_02990 [Thermosipho melanesiensis]OOC37534.1 hypothetical protein SU68_02885 [Thermosipho melanesiensis]OOC39430.1 hypothetical protein SU69_02865 [Thermosipho melanesiensis]OOC39493.1 hypothetical protein SU70_02865 [Thermosipho melanesiensis]
MIVRAFRGLRPRRDMIEKVAAKPYDVVTTEEARKEAQKNPYTFYKVTRPEINFDVEVDTHSDEVILKGKEVLEQFQKEGVMILEDKPAIYIYREEWQGYLQTGFYATFSTKEYAEGKIKKHELTRKDKEDERARHVKLMRAHTGPVFLMYRSRPEIDNLIMKHTTKEPEYDYTDDSGIHHTLWVVKDEKEINEIVDAFKDVEAFYIADGHHRAAAAARAAEELAKENPNHTGNEEYNFFLAVLFPHTQLNILDYNRVVKDLNNNTKEEFLKKVSEKFEVEETEKFKPSRKHEFAMYLEGKWYKLTAKAGIFNENDVVSSLDVAILQENLLKPILGIENPRTDKRINFVGGIKGIDELERLVDSGEYKVAFALYPTSIEDLLKVADEGKTMPPKSTWFEPKLKSGIIVHLM